MFNIFTSWLRGNVTKRARRSKLRHRVKFQGRNNAVTLAARAKIGAVIHIHGSNNIISFGEKVRFNGEIVIRGNGQTIRIGDRTTAEGARLLCFENCDLTIGADCMLSRDIEIRTSDYHSVIDLSDGLRINLPSSVQIGNHVWIGMRAVVSKGSRIPDNTIVGACAFVSGCFDEQGTAIAGVPARVIKRGITWSRKRVVSIDLRSLHTPS